MKYLLVLLVLLLVGCTYKVPLLNHLSDEEMQTARDRDICNQTHDAKIWWDDEGIHDITSKGGT